MAHSKMPYHLLDMKNPLYRTGKIYNHRLTSGLMPGQHIVSRHEMDEALHNAKMVRGLNPHEDMPMPHVMHIAEAFANDHPRGGFLPALLPLAAGALMPLVSQAVSGLVGGLSNHFGKRLAGGGMPRGCGLYGYGLSGGLETGNGFSLYGNGIHNGIGKMTLTGHLPRPIRDHKGQRHFVIHGEGFRDIIKSMLAKAKGVFTGEPLKAIGRTAGSTILDLLKTVILGKVDDLATKGKEKATDYVNRAHTNLSNRFGLDKVKEEGDDELPEETPEGSGYRKRGGGYSGHITKRHRRGGEFVHPSFSYY